MPAEQPRALGFTVKALNNQIKRHLYSRKHFQEEIKLTGMQFGVLGFLARHTREGQDIFQKDIEAEFNIRRSTATGILQLMEKNGLLHREGVPYDARLKKLVLTDEAWALHGAVSKEIEALENQLGANIPPEDLAAFYRVVDQMMKNLSE